MRACDVCGEEKPRRKCVKVRRGVRVEPKSQRIANRRVPRRRRVRPRIGGDVKRVTLKRGSCLGPEGGLLDGCMKFEALVEAPNTKKGREAAVLLTADVQEHFGYSRAVFGGSDPEVTREGEAFRLRWHSARTSF